MAPAPFFGDEKARLISMRTKLREIGGIGRGLWNMSSPMGLFNEGYVQWYTYLERVIVEMLEGLGYEIDAGNSDNGQHRYHEAVLELLKDPTNPFHELLGERYIHQLLKTAKTFRNIWTGNKHFSEKFNPFICRKNICETLVVELALWGAFGVFISELKQRQAREREAQIQEQKRRREHEELISEKEKLKEKEDKLREWESEKEKQWSKCEARAEEVYENAAERQRQIKEATKQLETKTALKKEVEKLKGTVKELKESRVVDTKKAVQEAAEKEKVHTQGVKEVTETHEREIDQLKKAHERKIDQLEEAHRREEKARRITYYAESKAMIIRHQHSLELEPPPNAVVGDAKDDGIDLASLVRNLMAGHIRDRTAAKSLKEEVGRLRDQVANYEAYKQTDFGVVQALMEKMEGCTEPGHHTLKGLFGQREYPAL